MHMLLEYWEICKYRELLVYLKEIGIIATVCGIIFRKHMIIQIIILLEAIFMADTL